MDIGARTPSLQGRTSVMASLRTWRTVAAALLLVMLATTAHHCRRRESTTPGHQHGPLLQAGRRLPAQDLRQSHPPCLAARPAAPMGAGPAGRGGRHPHRSRGPGPLLGRVLRRLGGQRSPAVLVEAFRQTIAELGTVRFVGFAYPPRARQAVALVQSTSGVRGAVQIGVTNGRPALIEFLEVQGAGPTIVPKGRSLGLVRHRRAAAVSALHRPRQPHGGVRGRADHRLV